MPGLLYADDLALYGESEENLKVIMEHFVEVCMGIFLFSLFIL